MKINTKINKLGVMIVGLLVSTASVCFTGFEKRKLTIKDVKNELKSLSPLE